MFSFRVVEFVSRRWKWEGEGGWVKNAVIWFSGQVAPFVTNEAEESMAKLRKKEKIHSRRLVYNYMKNI